MTGHWLEPIQALVMLYTPTGLSTGHVLSWSGFPSLRHSHPSRTHLSKADPWLWVLVRREKTLRSLRGRVGGEEGGVKPMSAGLSQRIRGTHDLELLTWHLTGTRKNPGPQSPPAHVSACPRLTWQAAHGRRISAGSGVRCPSPGTAWDCSK